MKILAKIAALMLVTGLAGTTLTLFNTPCATEDSTMCYWQGDKQGNRTGTSYMALTDSIVIRTN